MNASNSDYDWDSKFVLLLGILSHRQDVACENNTMGHCLCHKYEKTNKEKTSTSKSKKINYFKAFGVKIVNVWKNIFCFQSKKYHFQNKLYIWL